VLLFTATVMIGNERVELMLFDTTGQVMIAALNSVHSALFSFRAGVLLAAASVKTRARRTTSRTFTVNHRCSLRLLLSLNHNSVTPFQRSPTDFVESVAYSTSSYFLSINNA